LAVASWVVAGLLLLPGAVVAAPGRAAVTVVHVVDGDTVDVREGSSRLRVRLLGVDAPEVAHRDRPGEPFGRAATRHTRKLLDSARSVELEVAGDRIDAYGRTLGFLWLRVPGLAEPVNLSEELLRQGLGRVVRHFEYPGKARFLSIEEEARGARRGLWRQ
jgi:endonuclease YncB( thermonuclease family)